MWEREREREREKEREREYAYTLEGLNSILIYISASNEIDER